MGSRKLPCPGMEFNLLDMAATDLHQPKSPLAPLLHKMPYSTVGYAQPPYGTQASPAYGCSYGGGYQPAQLLQHL
ncbi:hypothetical protein Tco_0053593 [Tanacetum coccineum]